MYRHGHLGGFKADRLAEVPDDRVAGRFAPPRVGFEQPRQHAQQGAFPAPVGADDADLVARVHGYADIGQHLAGAVKLARPG